MRDLQAGEIVGSIPDWAELCSDVVLLGKALCPHVHSLYLGVLCRLQTDAGGKRQAFTRRVLRVKLCTDWSDRCAVNERVVETIIPEHPMPSIQMTSAFTGRQAIKSLQERSLPRDAR